MGNIIAAAVLFLLSGFAFVLSFRSFLGKGILLNNTYLYASKQEREAMNKAPYYRQSAVVFLMIGLIFLLNGLMVLLRIDWLVYPVAAVAIAALIYAIASTVAIEKQNKQK